MGRFAILLLIGFALFVLLVRLLENKFVFFPLRYPDGVWEEAGAMRQDQYFRTEDDITLHGWYFAHPEPMATVLLLHGNAGNLSHRLDLITAFQKAVPAEVFIFDYRGYGRSEGKPSEEGIYRDARAAYSHLVRSLQKEPRRIVIWGRSLGGAVAIDLAQKVPAAGLILESTFTSGRAMAKRMFGAIPVWWFMSIRFDSMQKIAQVAIPKLFLHGTADEVIPFSMGRKLFERAPEPKTFIALEGASHNDTYIAGGAEYFAAIKSFLLNTVSLSQAGSESKV